MRIGIIGGGQLGKMLAISASRMGHSCIVLDPNENCPASNDAQVLVGSYDDSLMVEKLCGLCDVVTYEFENVPAEVITNKKIVQGYRPLALSQNRNIEKENARDCELLVNNTYKITNLDEFKDASLKLGYPFILKTAQGGYDGLGQVIVRSVDTEINILDVECIAEELIEFDYEISVIAVRGMDGTVVTLPVPRNEHINNILHMSIVPNEDTTINKIAIDYTSKLLVNSDIFGIVAVEFFVKGDKVYFNEMAPRPHNSGHYSIEGCDFSQFDLALKAILNEKLPVPNLLQPTIMVNLLGSHMENVIPEQENVYIHDYGKTENRSNRKMGHVTFTNITYKEVNKIVKKYWGSHHE